MFISFSKYSEYIKGIIVFYNEIVLFELFDLNSVDINNENLSQFIKAINNPLSKKKEEEIVLFLSKLKEYDINYVRNSKYNLNVIVDFINRFPNVFEPIISYRNKIKECILGIKECEKISFRVTNNHLNLSSCTDKIVNRIKYGYDVYDSDYVDNEDLYNDMYNYTLNIYKTYNSYKKCSLEISSEILSLPPQLNSNSINKLIATKKSNDKNVLSINEYDFFSNLINVKNKSSVQQIHQSKSRTAFYTSDIDTIDKAVSPPPLIEDSYDIGD